MTVRAASASARHIRAMAPADESPASGNLFLDVNWVERIARFTAECERAYEVRSRHPGAAVTVFGSARSRPGDVSYEGAVRLGRSLAERGVLVITGGGPGIMEAANRGAYEVDPSLSIGFNIELPKEQSGNDYVSELVTFSDFAPRKVSMIDLAQGFVLCQGGFGTRDELYEALTKMQTGRILRRPLVLLGEPGTWDDLLLDANHGADAGMISCEDHGLLQTTADPELAAELARGPALAELAAAVAGDPDSWRMRPHSIAQAVPAWEDIHHLLREHGRDAALLEPTASPDGSPPVVVVPAASMQEQVPSPGGRLTVGGELDRRLQSKGYRARRVPVMVSGVDLTEYTNERDGHVVTVASIDWGGAERPRPVIGLDDAVAQSRYALGPRNHVLPEAHRMAVRAAMGRTAPEQLIREGGGDPGAVDGAIALLTHQGREGMRLAAELRSAQHGGPPIVAGAGRRELDPHQPQFETGIS